MSSGSIAVIGIAAQDNYNDAIADAAETRLMRTRPADEVIIDERPFGHYYRANGTDTVTVTVQVVDEQGVIVADGTPVTLSTTRGTLANTNLFTVDGYVSTILTAPTTPGDATLTAASNGKSDTAVVYFRNPIANQIVLTGSSDQSCARHDLGDRRNRNRRLGRSGCWRCRSHRRGW